VTRETYSEFDENHEYLIRFDAKLTLSRFFCDFRFFLPTHEIDEMLLHGYL
jgi:hypothetical protein